MSPKTVKSFAPAKVNLSLHITGQQPDGYHKLDSIVAFADVGDRLSCSPSRDLSLTLTGDMVEGVPEGAENLVLRAAHALSNGTKGARILLEKNLPAAAGIGGGSSDAAAALRGLSRLWGTPLEGDYASLGADVPVCLLAKAQRMRGVGDILEPVDLPPLPAVLINPGIEVATHEVFQALEKKTNAPMADTLPKWSSVEDCAAWLAAQRNDLDRPARTIAAEVDEVLDELELAPGCLLARMSGSGATCFGLFPDRSTAQGAAGMIASLHPMWWVETTLLS